MNDIVKGATIIAVALLVIGSFGIGVYHINNLPEQEPEQTLPDEIRLNFMGVELPYIVVQDKPLWFDYQVEKEGPGYVEALETFIYINDVEIYSTYDYLDNTNEYIKRVVYTGEYPYEISGIKNGQIIAKAGDVERVYPFKIVSNILTFATNESIDADLHPVLYEYLWDTAMFQSFDIGITAKINTLDLTAESWGWAGKHIYQIHMSKALKAYGYPLYLIDKMYNTSGGWLPINAYLDFTTLDVVQEKRVGRYFTVSLMNDKPFDVRGTLILECV